MLSRIRLLPGLLALSLLALLPSCASTPAAEAGPAAAPGEHTITVQNDHTSFLEAAIYIQPDAGAVQVPLGSVPAGESRTFTYSGARGWHRLIARRNTGDIMSEQFTMPDGARIEWRTSQRRVQVRSR
jgi:hypothetical protein